LSMTQDEPPRLQRQNSSRQSSTSRNIRSTFNRLFGLSEVAVLRGHGGGAHEGGLAAICALWAAAAFAEAAVGSHRPTTTAYAVLSAWAAYSLGLLIAHRRGASFLRRRAVLIHVVDVTAVALVIFLVDGTGLALFVALGFVMFAAAYRWGVRETLFT